MHNIKMDLLQTGLGVLDWIGLAQDRDKLRVLVNTCALICNHPVPFKLFACALNYCGIYNCQMPVRVRGNGS
jgi:hypothetical protein